MEDDWIFLGDGTRSGSDSDSASASDDDSGFTIVRRGRKGGDQCSVVASDDAPAKASVSAFVRSLGLRPMDVGPLPMARTLEHTCLLSLGLMTHSVKHTDFSIGVSLLG